MKEHVLARVSAIFLGIGVLLTGFFPSYSGLIITTLIMSVGFHYYETVNQSLTLQYFSKKEAPLIFAKLKSVGAMTNIVVGGAIFILMKLISYQASFALLGGAVIILTLLTLFVNPVKNEVHTQHKHMVFRKHYWLFYVLTFLSGARRQIFVVFSVFLMVERFKFSVSEIAALFIINNLVKIIFMPLIGKAINHFGERKLLSVEYLTLIPIFLVYAYVENRYVIMGMYILDHIVFNFSIALKTFFQKIADPKDIAPSMAVSFTINHIAAVVFPVLGGMLWILDFKIPFFMGISLAVLSFIFTQFIDHEITHKEVD